MGAIKNWIKEWWNSWGKDNDPIIVTKSDLNNANLERLEEKIKNKDKIYNEEFIRDHYLKTGDITEEQFNLLMNLYNEVNRSSPTGPTGMTALNLTGADTGKAGIGKTAYVPPSTLTGTATSTPTPTPTPTPEVPDTTDENVSTTINPSGYITAAEWMKWLEEDRAARWEREDTIRAETQAREDNAWQRGVRDMQLAGINPNLINATPAASGGGITNSNGIDYSGLMSEQAAKYSADVQSEIAAMDRQFQKETIEMGQKFELLLQENSYNRQEALEAMKAENELYLQEYLQKWKEELLKYEIITENEYKIALQEDAQLSAAEQGKKNRTMYYILGFANLVGTVLKAIF